QFPLHNGEAFGLAGRWIVFFSGLTPAVLYVTGVTIWWRRRRSRRRQRQTARSDRPRQRTPSAGAPVSVG
ncbi:MAG: PepSY domain-containing protein, partial [Planctomycetaceae bacterium]